LQRIILNRKLSTEIKWEKVRIKFAKVYENTQNMGGDTCSTHHASWGKFIQMLCYRAERDDGRVVRVNPI